MVDYEKLSQESNLSESAALDAGGANDGTSWKAGGGLESSMGVQSATGPAKRRVNEGMLLLAVVLAVAAGVLFLMRKTGAATIDKSLASVELKIEQALAQAGLGDGQQAEGVVVGVDALFRNSDDVIAMFVNDPANKQVPPSGVQKNPFLRPLTGRAASEPVTALPVVTAEDRQRQIRLQQVRAELATLTLQTVMNGRTPIAVVSNKVVREQDQLGSFTVVAIEPMAVVLTADGNSYRLTMKPPAIEAND